ncbi:MAG: hypothetical protein IGS39_24470 [Calothrix sp. C42_A2020_038]|nr:hypothetical protein [Calothrix sp. C42_A2020_038]
MRAIKIKSPLQQRMQVRASVIVQFCASLWVIEFTRRRLPMKKSRPESARGSESTTFFPITLLEDECSAR